MEILLDPLLSVVQILVDAAIFVVLAQVVLSWLIYFKLLEADNKYVLKAQEVFDIATSKIYKKIREKVPSVAGIDFSPAILVLALIFVQRFVSVALQKMIMG